MQFIRWSHKIEGPSGAELWLKEHGNQSKSPLNTHALHPPESGHFPTCLESKSLGECSSFPLSSQQVLNTITHEGKPHDPLDLPSFVPAKETAVNDSYWAAVSGSGPSESRGWVCLLTLPLDFAEMLPRCVPSARKWLASLPALKIHFKGQKKQCCSQGS